MSITRFVLCIVAFVAVSQALFIPAKRQTGTGPFLPSYDYVSLLPEIDEQQHPVPEMLGNNPWRPHWPRRPLGLFEKRSPIYGLFKRAPVGYSDYDRFNNVRSIYGLRKRIAQASPEDDRLLPHNIMMGLQCAGGACRLKRADTSEVEEDDKRHSPMEELVRKYCGSGRCRVSELLPLLAAAKRAYYMRGSRMHKRGGMTPYEEFLALQCLNGGSCAWMQRRS